MATGVTNFPGSLDTTATILNQANDCSSLLNGAITDSATSLDVVDASLFPTAGIARIDDEFIKWTGKTTNTLTGLSRGAYSSTAASHATAADVRMTVMAGYHNVLVDAIIAIETKLGSGSDVAASGEALLGTGAGTSAWAKIANANIDAAAAIAITKLAITGTPNGAKFLRDDGSWQLVTGAAVADGDYGDITVSSSGTSWAIDNDAVSYAKMQNVSAASKLLGRGDSGSGDVQEITLGSGLTMTGTTLSASGGAGAWSAITDPSGNLSLAMGSNLTTLTWAGNYSTSSAFKLAGNNTSATGPLVEFSSAGSNNMSVLILKPRGGRSFEADKLGSLLLGKDAPGNTDTDGYVYLGTIGSNLFPSGTPTTNTGFAPITLQSNGTAGDYSIWAYMGSAWRDLGGQHKRYDTGSGNGAQTIDFNSSTSANVTRVFTLSGGDATFTFSNPPKIGSLITLVLVQDGTGSRLANFPASCKFPAGVAPTLTTTANKRDIITFFWDNTNYWNVSTILNL